MAPEEAAAVTKLSRLTLSLALGSLYMLGSAIAVLSFWDGSQTSDWVLTVGVMFLSAMVGSMAGLIFFSRGGATSQHAYLAFLLPLLYVYTLLVMYVSVKLAIFVSTKLDNKDFESSRQQLVIAAIAFWVGGLAEIIVTLRLPRLHSFLKDFQQLPRSKLVVLKEWVFHNHKLHDDDDEVNEL